MVGYDWFPVAKLVLFLDDVGDLTCIRMIARLVGPSLSSLILNNNGRDEEPKFYYEVLSIFFQSCPRIKSLYLQYFDFGHEPLSFLSYPIRSGMGRLRHLKIINYDGSFGVIVENISIRLISFEYRRDDIWDSESSDDFLNQIDQVSRSYPTLESLVLDWDGGAEVDPSKVLGDA
jgi:hypothetical protein